MTALIALSQHYGSNADYVIAGGGNSSWKNDRLLFIKGSGQSLATIQADGFVTMDRAALSAIWTHAYPHDTDLREKAVLASLMATRFPGEEAKRPSVETLLHDLMPFAFVVHTHPTLVNAISCAQDGESSFRRLFGDRGVWIPLVNPGFTLAQMVKAAMTAFQKQHGRVPPLIFMQNHGVVVAGDSPEAIQAEYDQVLTLIEAHIHEQADLVPQAVDPYATDQFQSVLEPLARQAFGVDQLHCVRSCEKTVLSLAADDQAFGVLSSSFTPDHIVYMGVSPVRVDKASDLPRVFREYAAQYDKPPQVVLAKGLGAWCLGVSEKTARQAQQLFLDAVKIAIASKSFGGPRFMDRDHIDFIRNWEVESYRSKISSGA